MAPDATPRLPTPVTPGNSGPQPVLAGADDRYQAALVEMAAQQARMIDALYRESGSRAFLRHVWADILDVSAQGVRISDARE